MAANARLDRTVILAAAFTTVFWVWAAQEERREGPGRRRMASRPVGPARPDPLELFRQAFEPRDAEGSGARPVNGRAAVTRPSSRAAAACSRPA